MSGNSIGLSFVVTSFGESHGPAIGCVIDGCPPNLQINSGNSKGVGSKKTRYFKVCDPKERK